MVPFPGLPLFPVDRRLHAPHDRSSAIDRRTYSTLDGPQNLIQMPFLSRSLTLPIKRHACYEGRRWVARGRAAHAAFLRIRWLSTGVVEAG